MSAEGAGIALQHDLLRAVDISGDGSGQDVRRVSVKRCERPAHVVGRGIECGIRIPAGVPPGGVVGVPLRISYPALSGEDEPPA